MDERSRVHVIRGERLPAGWSDGLVASRADGPAGAGVVVIGGAASPADFAGLPKDAAVVAPGIGERALGDVVAASGHDPARVVAPGTLAASLRLERGLATRLGVAPGDVRAHVAGESGPRAMPLWSSACAGGMPVVHFLPKGKRSLTAQERSHLSEDAKQAGPEDEAVALRLLVRALIAPYRSILCVSACRRVIVGADVDPVWLSMPSEIGRGGLLRTIDEWPLNAAEAAGLRAAAQRISAAR